MIRRAVAVAAATVCFAVVAEPTTEPRVSGATVNWSAMANCLSGGDWQHPPVRLNPSGVTYSGGLLLADQITWALYGGLAYAPEAWQASRKEQIAVAKGVMAEFGPDPRWDDC